MIKGDEYYFPLTKCERCVNDGLSFKDERVCSLCMKWVNNELIYRNFRPKRYIITHEPKKRKGGEKYDIRKRKGVLKGL